MALPLLKLTGASDSLNDEKKAELTEHLAELRTRLLRSAMYMIVACIITYNIFHPIMNFLSQPLIQGIKAAAHSSPGAVQLVPPGSFVFHSFFGPFLLRLQLSLYAGLVLASPFIVVELWGFVSPGLTPAERRPVRLVAPFSALLFIAGGSLAFWVLPVGVKWFLSYLTDFPGAVLLQDPEDYVLFVVKMILAFGLMFQLPIIMLGLGKVGIINSKMLIQYWRHIVVGITVVAMVVTPSNDPFSMIVLAVPMVFLFLISIWLVKIVEPKAI